MLGPFPTGIGVYGQKCAEASEQYFDCLVVSSYYKSRPIAHVESPQDIVIGFSRWAALKRILYLWRGFPKSKGLLYTPTHHGILGRKNQIITILDLIPLRFPAQHRFQYYYFKYLLPKIMWNCAAVFTISESVKKEIASFYRYPLDKIFVVPCGLDQEKYFQVKAENVNVKSYLLVVGAAYYHKNIQELIHHHGLWDKTYTLKIVGARGAYRDYLASLIEQYNIQNIVEFTGYLSDEDLVKTMQACKALVYPSLCEGFGMPPLEVMACGRPVIISDIPVHKEICSDAPIYITPGNKDSWVAAFSTLEDHVLIDVKISKGVALTKKFTWQKSGEILIETLLSIMPGLSKRITQ
jgi:glycosyltransferase involved in cell wall biosynthesis